MTSRHPVSLAVLALLALAVAACAGSAEPGWTFAPVPSPTPVPSASPAASGSPAGSPSASAAGSPSPSAASSAAASGGGTVVKVVALNIKWTAPFYTAPAGQPFKVELDNQDNGIPHDVSIRDAANTELYKSDIVTGPTSGTFDVPAIPAGDYKLICTIHPTLMVAELTVGG
jgi:plastocyanin